MPGLESICAMRQLSVLALSGSRVSDHGLEYLARLDDLRYLSLRGTGVTDAGLQHLSGMSACTRSTFGIRRLGTAVWLT